MSKRWVREVRQPGQRKRALVLRLYRLDFAHGVLRLYYYPEEHTIPPSPLPLAMWRVAGFGFGRCSRARPLRPEPAQAGNLQMLLMTTPRRQAQRGSRAKVESCLGLSALGTGGGGKALHGRKTMGGAEPIACSSGRDDVQRRRSHVW